MLGLALGRVGAHQAGDLAELRHAPCEQGIDLVSVADYSLLSDCGRQLAELSGAADEEAAD